MKSQAIQFGVAAVLAGAAATCMMDFDEFDQGVLSTSTSSGTTTSGTGGVGGTIFTGGGGTTSTSGTGGSTSGTGGSTSGTGGGTGGGGGGVGGQGGAGGAVTTAFVGCETTPCDVSNGGYCCLPQDGGNASCETGGTGCSDGFAQTFCDEPSDCPPAEECCGTFSIIDGYSLLECVASCSGPSHFILCDSNADCGGNDECDTSSYLPAGYEVCK
jgi:hypothetical protein